MGMEMTIDFPGNKKVNATLGDLVIPTDQSRRAGGDASAPEPYMLFLASIGTCAGIYVKGFCDARNLSAEGIRLRQTMEWAPDGSGLSHVKLDIEVPPEFPERYHKALVRAADQCAVKKTMMNPPRFEIATRVAAESAA